MAKSKLTLIVDGNWVLMSRLCKIHTKYSSDSEIVNELKTSIIKSISSVTWIFRNIDNIIFVADGGSWRSDVTPPKILSDNGITYKGNRVKSPDYDWDVIFGAFGEIMTELNNNGITAVREEGIEGDDWIWYWSTKLNKEGTNCLIWSKDKDLTQLVKTDQNGCFTAWWNKDNGVFVEDKDDDDVDWFFNQTYNDNVQIFENITRKTETTKINPKRVVIDKVFRGDTSDNIMPIIKRKCSTSKEYRLSEKDIDKVFDIYDMDEVNSFIDDVVTRPKYLGKVTNSKKVILEHFNYNLRIVSLDERSYPKEILEKMNQYTTYNTCCDLSNILNSLQAAKNADVVNILEMI